MVKVSDPLGEQELLRTCREASDLMRKWAEALCLYIFNTHTQRFPYFNLQTFRKKQYNELFARIKQPHTQLNNPTHSHIHLCILRTPGVQLTPGSTAALIPVKRGKHHTLQSSMCVNVECEIWANFVCLQTSDSIENFLIFSRLEGSTTFPSLLGGFSILAYTLHSAGDSPEHFSVCQTHVLEMWPSVSLGLD